MPVSNPLLTTLKREDHPRPITGWALERLATLDAAGARGLVADLLTASPLRRQVAFLVIATIDLAEPEPFLGRLGERDGSVGEVIRTRRARDLIAAVFDIEPDDLPRSFERALLSIGDDPLVPGRLYRRLFEILSAERFGRKAHALKYCNPITSAAIQAVGIVDPVLLHPEMTKRLYSAEHAKKADRVVRFLREVCSTATDEALHGAARQAVGATGLDRFARAWVERADRFPAPPFPAGDNVKPLTTAADMAAVGRAMSNCLKSKIGEVLLGYAYYYVVGHRALSDAEPIPVVVEVTPLSDGRWVIGEVQGARGGMMPAETKAAVVRRMQALGALLPVNPRRHPDAGRLQELLGVYRFGGFFDETVGVSAPVSPKDEVA